ncbi:CBS domain-containing protein [Haloglomus salinum]|uniref:CBS domain-containing protein n=1 Tax=Haloglomus salinum TaxID=2962673 RepID=UPI0020C94A69|nr:CBS domain-containing protein [Haloglomus salinum]
MDHTDSATARAIATPDPATRPVGAGAGETSTWLQAQGFDSAPVVDDDDRPVGYVTVETAQEANSDDLLEAVASPLTIEVLISGDASFETVLDALYERSFYYLGDRDRISGILTRADLNSESVYRHLFTHLSRLEHAFRACITEHAPDWRETTPGLKGDALDDIDQRREQAARANIELEPIHYAQFSTLKRIVANNEACWEACGFSAGHQAGSRLDKVVELRNDVAHSRPVIQNTNRGIGESGRTITELEETYNQMQELQERLAPMQ